MDHHHRHNPHHHLHHAPSSRYAPLPPQQPSPAAPVFLAPDLYGRQPHLSFPPQPPLPAALPPPPTVAHHRDHHHHHRPDNGGLVYVSYAPSSSHASDDHGRLLAPADPPDRLLRKAPHPPVPALRVSDRIIFPEGHPEAPRMHQHPPRRSSSGEVFVGGDFRRERILVLDERQGGLPFRRREGEAVDLAEQEDVATRLGLLGRKRARWEEGRALGEDPLLECFLPGRDPKRLISGVSTGRRRCDVVYDLRAVDAESSRGSTCAFPSERGQPVLAFPRPPVEMPVRSSSVYSVSKLELLGKSPMMESETLALGNSHGFRENNFASRGKRYVFGGEEEVHTPSKKAVLQKASVLSRIQFTKPVYRTKCEPEIISTMSPLPVSQTLAFSEGKQFETDVPVKLDVSFKSDVLVAKEILPSSVSASPRCIGEVCARRTTKKNVAKAMTVSPSTSFLRSESKVTATHTHKLKIREERFARLSPGGKPNKERTSKAANKVLASSNSIVRNFDDEVTFSRTPRNKVANEVSVSSDPVQNSMDRVPAVRTTEQERAAKVVILPDVCEQSYAGRITSTRSPKRQQTKEIFVPQHYTMANPNDRNPKLKILKLPSSDGVITSERYPKEKLATEILINSSNAEPRTGGMLNNTRSTEEKSAKETLVAQKANSLHRNEKVTSMDDHMKEMLDNISFPSVPVLRNAEENVIVEGPEEKPGKDTFISPSAVVNSDKRIATSRTLKKKTIKTNKKKKVVASIAPHLPSMDPPGEISKGHVLTNSSVKGMEPLEDIQVLCTMNCSHMDQKNLKEENRVMKHSEVVQTVSTSGSSSKPTDLEDCGKFASGYPEGMAPGTERTPEKKLIKKNDTEEFTLISCAFDSNPVQEICGMPLLDSSFPCENPMQSKGVQKEGPLANFFRSDKVLDTLHGEEVHQDRLDAREVHSGSTPESFQDVGHLEMGHDGSTKTTVCLGADFQAKGEEQHTLTSCHDDARSAVLLGMTETSDISKLVVDNSTAEPLLQRVMLQGHLETDIIKAPSNIVVPVDADTDESPKKKNSIGNACKNFKSSVQQQGCRGNGNVNLREEAGSDKHFSASKKPFPDTVCGKKLHDHGMAFFDGKSSVKPSISSSNRDKGHKLSPRPESSAVLEDLETVCSKKDATTVLHGPVLGRSVSLQVVAQSAISELEKEMKQKKSPAEVVIFTENEVDNKNDIAGGERSRELHADIPGLPIEDQDAVLNSYLLTETNGLEGGSVLHLPSISVFPQSSPSVVGAKCPGVNPMAEQVAYRVHSSPLNVSEKSSPEDLATVSEEMHFEDLKQTVSDMLDCKSCHSVNILEKPYGDFNIKKDHPSDSMTLSTAELKISGKSDLMDLPEKISSQETQEAEKQLNRSHQLTGKEKLTGMKVCQRPGISKLHPNQKSLSTRTFKKPPSHSMKHNKWYRTENPPVSLSSEQMKWPGRFSLPRQSPKKLGKIPSSYIRKGNSLIRKSSPALPLSHPYHEQTALDQIRLPETNKSMSIEDKIVDADHVNFSGTKILSSSFERPKTPPLPLNTKSTHPSLSSPQTLIEDPLSEPGGEDNAIPLVGTQAFDPNEENHSIVSTEESRVSGKKKLIYVKHRSNQLIAAPAIDANKSAQATEEGPALPFTTPDIYYRNKNKLIRDTSLSDGQLKQEISLPNDCSDAKCHGPSKTSSLKAGAKVSRKTRLEKAMEKTYKQSRFSLVWTLSGSQSQNNKCFNVLKHPKVLPYLFPWKRSAYRRDFITKMGSNLTKHSQSLISSKLRLSRQRDTIYTISNGGFSLRKSGLLSVGGSNLKWSKSIERRSRKASEEATAAIVEHERKKKKLKGTSCADLNMKSENCSQRKLALGIQLHQGERIFRVGTILYKMDSSRRTLVRIPDEQTPAIANSQSVHGAKMSIVPRRLLIGNDEYVRFGNGNQLVRDPKKLVRILANEKIRWSLHTARLRSVRKQQYCQFFTRFGKCNKEDGKCPYIHDPTKTAICTRFLKGLCSSPNCKLTHKVIPERMPDCSYFLQGLCTNTSCPYRHVNVNPKASICEGFLKGYCRDGDECRKKHSYVCPHFEASGECRHGSTCKLHHPKRASKQANKSRKRKRSPIHDHGRGRYFGCSVAEAGESHVLSSSMEIQQGGEDIFFHKGRFAEYISLDIDTDDDAVELDDLMVSHPILMDSDRSDSQSSDADALIKPIRVMNMDLR